MNTSKNNTNKKVEALIASLKKSNIKMLKEKIMRGETVVIADANGNIIHADPKMLYKEMVGEGE